MLFLRILCRVRRPSGPLGSRFQSSSTARPGYASPKEFKVVLNNKTLYVDQELAEALGWDAAKGDGVSLQLNGWAPHYFTITRTGSDSELLARHTVQTGCDPKMQNVLDYLKDR